jgi:hypothetical protein
MIEYSAIFLKLNALAALAAVVAIILEWRRWRPGPLGVYVPLALATVLTIGNVSGDVNYFLEPTVALALAVPLIWSTARGNGRLMEGRRLPLLMAGLALAQLAMLFHVPNGFMSQFPEGPAKGATPSAEDVRVGDQVLRMVREAGPNALIEPAGFAVLAQIPVWFQPLDLVGEGLQGRWTPDILVKTINDRRWKLVVLDYKFLPGEVLHTVEREYIQTDGFGSPNGLSYFVYRPRLADSASGAATNGSP